ncbi:hydroxymethylglutaryl-CoA synthase [Candidatus Gottesmanbacteria bacterium]|nr:hydroxymethylglutaryl-CoA synthase [Candidatus Gottesmanbacteria bacterium]
MTGIVSFGTYIPRNRLTINEIASVWGKDGSTISSSLGVYEKAVAGLDEDTTTVAIEAARQALRRVNLKPTSLGCLILGSESHPYAVKPTSTTVGEFLGAGNSYMASDLEFACKAGTTGLLYALSLVSQKKVAYGMAIGADCAQAKPHDILEYTAGAGAGCYIVGSGSSEVIAEILDYTSYSSDTPDFWRRDGIAYPSHAGRFTGEPAYFTHVLSASKQLLEKTNMKPSDFASCVFHMPNGNFPKEAALRLGFTREQLEQSMVVKKIGNPYSASSLIGLATVLEKSKPNQYIFLASYGSGAGADSIILKTTKAIAKINFGKTVEDMIEDKKYVSYIGYLKARGAI